MKNLLTIITSIAVGLLIVVPTVMTIGLNNPGKKKEMDIQYDAFCIKARAGIQTVTLPTDSDILDAGYLGDDLETLVIGYTFNPSIDGRTKYEILVTRPNDVVTIDQANPWSRPFFVPRIPDVGNSWFVSYRPL